MTWRARLSTWGLGLVLGAAIGVASGGASALFLWLLASATSFRELHERLVYALPVAGLAIGWFYERFGRPIKAGNNLVIDTMHDGGAAIPRRMGLMVLLGTVLTHLFGGSAGREGTAVQIGASLADTLAQRLKVAPDLRKQLLIAGAAGGFGSVFGTPLAGAAFGLEFGVVAGIELGGVVPALMASFVGDLTTRALGIEHTLYPHPQAVTLSPSLLGKWLVFAVAVALVTVAFIELLRFLKRHGERLVPRLPLRMCVGGLAVVLAWKLVGKSDYLGLGVPTIVRAFVDPGLPAAAFALKLLFTAVTLGAGFLGGEVTPLFFVGAALGNLLARLLGIPLELGAGVGMAAVFAAAANVPLALSLMAMELLGVAVLPHVAIVCVVAYVLSGKRSIYSAQRVTARAGKWFLPR